MKPEKPGHQWTEEECGEAFCNDSDWLALFPKLSKEPPDPTNQKHRNMYRRYMRYDIGNQPNPVSAFWATQPDERQPTWGERHPGIKVFLWIIGFLILMNLLFNHYGTERLSDPMLYQKYQMKQTPW
jgi:hypothetical protein